MKNICLVTWRGVYSVAYMQGFGDEISFLLSAFEGGVTCLQSV